MLQLRVEQDYRDHLGPDEVYPGLTEHEAAQAAVAERRNNLRAPVIKSGKIVVGEGSSQSVFNCLVLDESPSGVLVDLGTLVILPAEVKVQFSGGATYLARRRWGVGSRVGLEFIGGQIVTTETSERMLKVADVLERQGVVAAVGTLRGARFFDHEELRKVGEALEAAYYRMEAILTGKQSI
jgi:hypothetical protein